MPGDDLVVIPIPEFGGVCAEPSASAQEALSWKAIVEALFPAAAGA